MMAGLGFEEPADRLTAYMALVEHGDGCDACNEGSRETKSFLRQLLTQTPGERSGVPRHDL